MRNQTDVRTTRATEAGAVYILRRAFRTEHLKSLRVISLSWSKPHYSPLLTKTASSRFRVSGRTTHSLTQRFIKNDAGRNRNVQRLNFSSHRNAHQSIAAFAYQPMQTSAFPTEDHGRRSRPVPFRVIHRSIGGRSDNPDVTLFQLFDQRERFAARATGTWST